MLNDLIFRQKKPAATQPRVVGGIYFLPKSMALALCVDSWINIFPMRDAIS